MTGELDPLAGLAIDQHGNFTTRQASQAGFTRKQLRRHTASGALAVAGARVLRSPFVEHTPLAELAALLLDLGSGAVASGVTALAVHDFEGFRLQPPFHITLERGRYVERPPHHIHTTIELPAGDRTLVHGIPVLTADRAVIDASKQLTRRRLTTAYDVGLRDRKYTEDMIHERIVQLRGRGRHGIPKLIDVIEGCEATRGGHSWLERRFLQICADHGLPRPETQRVLASSRGKLVRVDFRFPATMVVGEVLGYRYHRGDRAQFSRDVERMNALVRQGYQPLQFTYDHVTLDGTWVVSELRTALGLPPLSMSASQPTSG
jgi:hypothetical protein